jgi:K+-sensing histidine kinase KdpD
MVQVLVNLLGNANKYGPPEATIQLKVVATEQEVCVSIADHGPGIHPGARNDIFRRFVYPQEGTQTSQAGAGLGLSVVKAIVEAHGGQVGVDDHPSGGAVFWFTLPIVKDEG